MFSQQRKTALPVTSFQPLNTLNYAAVPSQLSPQAIPFQPLKYRNQAAVPSQLSPQATPFRPVNAPNHAAVPSQLSPQATPFQPVISPYQAAAPYQTSRSQSRSNYATFALIPSQICPQATPFQPLKAPKQAAVPSQTSRTQSRPTDATPSLSRNYATYALIPSQLSPVYTRWRVAKGSRALKSPNHDEPEQVVSHEDKYIIDDQNPEDTPDNLNDVETTASDYGADHESVAGTGSSDSETPKTDYDTAFQSSDATTFSENKSDRKPPPTAPSNAHLRPGIDRDKDVRIAIAIGVARLNRELRDRKSDPNARREVYLHIDDERKHSRNCHVDEEWFFSVLDKYLDGEHDEEIRVNPGGPIVRLEVDSKGRGSSRRFWVHEGWLLRVLCELETRDAIAVNGEESDEEVDGIDEEDCDGSDE